MIVSLCGSIVSDCGTINKMKNKDLLLLYLVKNPFSRLHIRGLERKLNIPVQSLSRLVNQLRNEGIISTDRIGNIIIPFFLFSEKNISILKIIMITEQEIADVYVKRWISELKRLKNSDITILFGSVLTKKKASKDVDVLFITKKNKIKRLDAEIKELNKINIKLIHPIYQTHKDFRSNLKQKNQVIINALKGIIIQGHEELMSDIKEGL